MTWVKLDDQLHAHPKVMRAWNARPAALGLHLLALSHCGAYMTDGFVEEAFVGMKLPRKVERDKTVATLIEVGLWDRADGGYRIHDFLDYNHSKEQVQGRRRADSERKRGGFRADPEQDSERNPSGLRASHARAAAARPVPARPGPSQPVLASLAPRGGGGQDSPIDQVLSILRTCPRFTVDDVSTRVGVENAIASTSASPVLAVAAAHEAVVRGSDPTYRTTAAASVLSQVLRDPKWLAAQRQSLSPASETRAERRARRAATVRGGASS